MTITILGAGAFGTALAITLAQNGPVTLWARDAEQAAEMARTRRNDRRLPVADLPENVTVTAQIEAAMAETILLAMPMQQMGRFLQAYHALLDGRTLVACSKGIDLATGHGPTALIHAICPAARAAILTGPSFAADIARGLPTALTLACDTDDADLQERLSTPTLRIYRTTDTTGAELGGALKNVVAIAAGVVTGAELGDSARAALMTRGFAEMSRLAIRLGARHETLSGLSGFGDLVLTCTSALSRNFRFGQALGRGEAFDPSTTVEGVATAKAVVTLAENLGIEMPIAVMVAALSDHGITVAEATHALLSRPLKEE
ncbi:MAG TPA: NAD(P)H-dependent glycerol-3-phosphate dehydrogenase [Paenirhodobacter sp.]